MGFDQNQRRLWCAHGRQAMETYILCRRQHCRLFPVAVYVCVCVVEGGEGRKVSGGCRLLLGCFGSFPAVQTPTTLAVFRGRTAAACNPYKERQRERRACRFGELFLSQKSTLYPHPPLGAIHTYSAVRRPPGWFAFNVSGSYAQTLF